MRLKALSVLSVLALAIITTACEKSSPSRPSDVQTASASAESVTDARTGVTMVAAQPVSPAADGQIAYGSQPITITVANGVTTGSTALTYRFEVATDDGFSNLAFSKDSVAQGSGGRTSFAIDKLGGNKTYYWRVRVNSGSSNGPNSAVRAFAVGPEVVLGIPSPSSPAQGATAFAPLTLTVNNITRAGPAGPISYRFQVSDSSSFGNVLFDDSASEQGGGQTSIVVNATLKDGATFYWRAQAIDAQNGLTTSFSTVIGFTAQSFSMSQAVIHSSPPDLGSWPETARITSIEFTDNSFRVDFDKRDGPGRWPDVVPAGWDGPLQYTLGMCLNINGAWHCSGVVNFWYGRSLEDSGPPRDIALEWFYDPGRWGAMAGHQPVPGEVIGIFAGAGNLRGESFTQANCPRVCERTNVVLIPFPNGGAYFPFSALSRR